MARNPTPIDGLRRDHANMRGILALIGRQLDHLERFDAADYVLLASVLYYMRKFPSNVHHPKEDFIFRRLAERDPAWQDEVTSARLQHQEIYRLEDQLIQMALDSPPAGTGAVAELLEFGRRYLSTQQRHAEREEHLLFPVAEATLSAADWAEAAALVRKADADPLFGKHSEDRYRLLYQDLLRDTKGA